MRLKHPLNNQGKEGLHYKGKRNGYTLTAFFLPQASTGVHQEGSQGLWFSCGKKSPKWTSSFPSIVGHFPGLCHFPLMPCPTEIVENSPWLDH